MEEVVRDGLDILIAIVEAMGALVVFVGAVVAFALFCASQLGMRPMDYDPVRLRLARYLALGLEFQLGADILSTALQPTYDEIGKLAAIAAIRTFLQYTLSRELARAER
jgi:uncharacterized membrane protein